MPLEIKRTMTLSPEQQVLFEDHIEWALNLAVKMNSKRRFPFFELPTARNSALIGLTRAAQGYDRSFKVGFKSFAAWKVVGAIKDEMRALDIVRRSAKTYQLDPGSVPNMISIYNDKNEFCLFDMIPSEQKEVGFRTESAEQIEMMFKLIPHAARDVMRMYWIEDMTQMQIAKKIGRSENRVHQILKDALEEAQRNARRSQHEQI